MRTGVFTPHDFSSSFVLCSHSRFEELIALLVRQFSFCALVSIHTHTLVLLGCRRRVCGSASDFGFWPCSLCCRYVSSFFAAGGLCVIPPGRLGRVSRQCLSSPPCGGSSLSLMVRGPVRCWLFPVGASLFVSLILSHN